jgi:hypothetical protein
MFVSVYVCVHVCVLNAVLYLRKIAVCVCVCVAEGALGCRTIHAGARE